MRPAGRAPLASGSIERVARLLVDDQVGVLHELAVAPRRPGFPEFFVFYGEAADAKALGPFANSRTSAGASADWLTAKAKALGEAVERYCSAIYEPSDYPVLSYRQADFECVNPADFSLYSPAQYSAHGFPFEPLTERVPVRWVPAIDLGTGERVAVPAACVFLPYYFDRDAGEVRFCQPISTGLACHADPAEAAVSAVCEVVERDAFTITWQAKLSPPHVDQGTLTQEHLAVIRSLDRYGYRVDLLYITLDVRIPAVLAVARGRAAGRAAMAVAAAASTDPGRALLKSLEELVLCIDFSERLLAEHPTFRPAADYSNVNSRDDHVLFWASRPDLAGVEFLTASDVNVALPELDRLAVHDPAQALGELVERLADAEHRVLCVDLTTSDIREAGLTVVRAVIPGLHPLQMGHSVRALGGRRLRDVPARIGRPGVTDGVHDNPLPHPFP